VHREEAKTPKNLGSPKAEFLLQVAGCPTTKSLQDRLLLQRSNRDRRLLIIVSHDFGKLKILRSLSPKAQPYGFRRTPSIANIEQPRNNIDPVRFALAECLPPQPPELIRYISCMISNSFPHCHINRHVYRWPPSEPSKAQTPLTTSAGFSFLEGIVPAVFSPRFRRGVRELGDRSTIKGGKERQHHPVSHLEIGRPDGYTFPPEAHTRSIRTHGRGGLDG